MKRTILYLPFLSWAMMLLGLGSVKAQTLLFEVDFKEAISQMGIATQSYVSNPTEIGGYSGWVPNNCYAQNEYGLQVGTSTSTGTLTTPTISGISKNLSVVVVYSCMSPADNSTSFTVTSSNGTVSPTSGFTVDNNQRTSTVLITDCNPSTTITINAQRRFQLLSIRVYDIGEGCFFESFDNMKGTDDDKIPTSNTAVSADMLDHSSASVMDLLQAQKCILLRNSGSASYTTPTLSNIPSGKAILSFSIAGQTGGSVSYTPTLTLSITGGGTIEYPTLTYGDYSWNRYEAIITGMTTSSQITFAGQKVFLDDILLSPVPHIVVDQTVDNGTTIGENLGKLRTVELKRTLTKGIWNTLCLPFDISAASMLQVLGAAADPELRVVGSVNSGVFTFVEPQGTVTAGTPFLIRVKENVVNPVFTDVTVQQAAPKAVPEGETTQFQGIYSPTDLAYDGTNLFLGIDGNLYAPAQTTRRINGLRAYFVAPANHSIRADIGGDADAIIPIVRSSTIESPLYDLQGRRVDSHYPVSGIYLKDGRKIIVK